MIRGNIPVRPMHKCNLNAKRMPKLNTQAHKFVQVTNPKYEQTQFRFARGINVILRSRESVTVEELSGLIHSDAADSAEHNNVIDFMQNIVLALHHC